ncbi:phosphodiesterase [Agromyces archimandritae]|uniref:Phosphodiesterase n=1 Tax=Agromyces archimandritae TaxID=2781962 RepID=A0A975IND6_9MICO|nr:phosphodiesterase [Agromyces archimandritae]QTX04493.1 phosphodiesterase [Agromyces archimandritae]
MPGIRLGRYPAARHTLVHLSDTHFLAGGAPLSGTVDTESSLDRAVRQLERLAGGVDAIVVTGDVTDLGEPDAYRRVRARLEPLAGRLGARIVWVMGNHDERGAFRAGLLDGPAVDDPVDTVADVDGLRIVALDSTVPGYHHGELSDDRLAWLDEVLTEPAPSGTVIAMHHAPLPTPLGIMDILELRDQDAFAEVVRGRDVRAILGGHLHYATNGTFAGIPVAVAGAVSYTMDLSAPPRELRGIDGGRSLNLVHLFEEEVVTSVVPITEAREVASFSAEVLARLEAMTPEERLEAFSRKPAG